MTEGILHESGKVKLRNEWWTPLRCDTEGCGNLPWLEEGGYDGYFYILTPLSQKEDSQLAVKKKDNGVFSFFKYLPKSTGA